MGSAQAVAVSLWGVIPARWSSTRLPGKVLAIIGGRTMLERVWHAAVAAGCFDRVCIATDDERVARVARAFGAQVEASGPARSGTHRVARVTPPEPSVVAIQADQPFLDPAHLRALAALLPMAPVATLCAPYHGDLHDPARVKAVVREGRAVDFSRRPIPGRLDHHVHVGLYGFAPGLVHRCASAPLSPRARAEDLEQLAWLDAGIAVHVAEVAHASLSVDTPGQLLTARSLIR